MGGQTSRFGSECTGGRVKARSHSMLVLFQPLTLDLGVAPGDALSLLPQPAYMGATLPDEERVLAKRQLFRRDIRIAIGGKQHNGLRACRV
jgi:hypothetical protein